MHHDRKPDVSAPCVWLAEVGMLLNSFGYRIDFVHTLWISERPPLWYALGSVVSELQVAIVSVHLCLRIT